MSEVKFYANGKKRDNESTPRNTCVRGKNTWTKIVSLATSHAHMTEFLLLYVSKSIKRLSIPIDIWNLQSSLQIVSHLVTFCGILLSVYCTMYNVQCAVLVNMQLVCFMNGILLDEGMSIGWSGKWSLAIITSVCAGAH